MFFCVLRGEKNMAGKNKKKKTDAGAGVLASNRKAQRDYHILEQIEAGIVVATEDGRPLVDTTIRDLVRRANNGVKRRDLKTSFASLTIGSGSVAAVVAHPDALEQQAPRAGDPHRRRACVRRDGGRH